MESFSSFLISVDGMLGKEALAVLTNLSRHIQTKLEEPLLQVCGWFNGQIKIMVARLYYFTIHGDCLPITLREWEPDWDPGSGLGLAQ